MPHASSAHSPLNRAKQPVWRTPSSAERDDARPTTRVRPPFWPFIAAFLVIALAFTALFGGALDAEASLERVELQAREDARVRLAATEINKVIAAAASDARVAAASPAVGSFARTGDPDARAQASTVFTALASNKPGILQVRYVDAAGVEQLVARRGADGVSILPVSAHRDLSRHSSYLALREGAPGEAQFSPMDLEVDASGAVRTPRQPVLGIMTPLAAESGEGAGAVFLDVNGARLVTQMHKLMGSGTQHLLLNADGGYIVAPDARDSFGFTVGRDSFADRHPETWERISESTSGNLMASEGLYTFDTVIPDHVGATQGTQHEDDGHPYPTALKIVSFVPLADLPSASLARDATTALFYGLGLLAIAAAAAYVNYELTARRRIRRSIRTAKTRLEAIRDTLGEGLVVVDRQGMITDVNPECERMLGWRREQMLGQVSHKLFHNHPDYAIPAEECAMLAVASTGVTFRSEDEVFERFDGDAIHVGVSAAPLVVDGEVEGAVIVFRDISEIRAYQEEIRRLAFHDALTGLPNRRVLADRLDLAIASADRRSRPIGVLFLDLDGFKEVNDNYGHAVGDEFLKQISSRLSGCLRSSDTLARQGGDEFMVLLAEIEEPEEAEIVARRMIEGLAEPFVVDGFQLQAAVSIGVAVRMDGEGPEALITHADRAMYAAKGLGRNLYCVSGRTPVGLS